jgi:predicted kinase
MIVVMAGLPGTGKSTIARALADRLSGTVLSKDDIRHTLFTPRDVEYSTRQDDFCMEIMLQTAEYILINSPDRFVFLDGRTYSRSYQIERVADFATRLKQSFRVIECVCSEGTAKSRLQKSHGHPAANRNYELYKEVKAQFEEITAPKLLLDTDHNLQQAIAKAVEFLTTFQDHRTK